MTLNKSSRDPFASMFWDSVRKTCFVPIFTLVVFLLHTAVKFVPRILYSSEEGVGEKSS